MKLFVFCLISFFLPSLTLALIPIEFQSLEEGSRQKIFQIMYAEAERISNTPIVGYDATNVTTSKKEMSSALFHFSVRFTNAEYNRIQCNLKIVLYSNLNLEEYLDHYFQKNPIQCAIKL